MIGVMVAYLMRACLSIAITQMVVFHDETNKTIYHAENVCPDPEDYMISKPGENKMKVSLYR